MTHLYCLSLLRLECIERPRTLLGQTNQPRGALYLLIRLLVCIPVLFVLTGCASPGFSLLGTNTGWDANWRPKVLRDAQIGALRIRHTSFAHNDHIQRCEILEVVGEIGPDSTAVMERLLPKLNKCRKKDGSYEPNFVFLSSGGGLLKDGYRLGELFKQHQVVTVVPPGQICASSCAIAFLGGIQRRMMKGSTLLFHAPYTKSGIAIDCKDRGQVTDLKMYYQKVLGNQDGAFLLDRTMSYCDKANGWTLNADGAEIFGIVTIKSHL